MILHEPGLEKAPAPLVTFHWQELGHGVHLIARECGKCNLALCAGGKEIMFGEQVANLFHKGVLLSFIDNKIRPKVQIIPNII